MVIGDRRVRTNQGAVSLKREKINSGDGEGSKEKGKQEHQRVYESAVIGVGTKRTVGRCPEGQYPAKTPKKSVSSKIRHQDDKNECLLFTHRPAQPGRDNKL